jgi:hypothetical protein
VHSAHEHTVKGTSAAVRRPILDFAAVDGRVHVDEEDALVPPSRCGSEVHPARRTQDEAGLTEQIPGAYGGTWAWSSGPSRLNASRA